MPLQEFQPRDAGSLAERLKWADAEGLAVSIRGAGTKQSWGTPSSRGDVVVSTLGLDAPIDHVAGDLVATVPAGVSLAAVNDILRRERQWLPLDPGASGLATIGGVIATNDSGPRRHRYGTPRDLIIGIELALADGRLARAGGRVVKNVAGYDLSKLVCGSFGSLAVITSATFKLAPLPPASSTLIATVGDPRRLGVLALAIAASPLTPSTIELESPAHRLLVRFETSPRATEQQIAAADTLCRDHGAATDVLSGEPEAEAWRTHERRTQAETGATIKLAVLATDVGEMLSRVEAAAAAHGVEYTAVGRAVLGVILVRLADDSAPDSTRRLGTVITELRREARARRGSAVLVSSAPDLEAQVGAWGPIGDAAPLMRAVKARFDPRGTLNPGRGPWEDARS